LLKWWASNSGVEKISVFLEKLGATLEEEINEITNKLNEFRSEN
jgi:hypothetical protein